MHDEVDVPAVSAVPGRRWPWPYLVGVAVVIALIGLAFSVHSSPLPEAGAGKIIDSRPLRSKPHPSRILWPTGFAGGRDRPHADAVAATGNTAVLAGSLGFDPEFPNIPGGPLFVVSKDAGKSWRRATVSGEGLPAEVVAGGERGWVAFGEDTAWTSKDGVKWAARQKASPSDVTAVAATEAGFVATNDESVWTSTDGRSWKRVADPAGYLPDTIEDLLQYGSHVLITGQTGDEPAAAFSSDDGMTWRKAKVPSAELVAGNDAFFGITDTALKRSTDGVTWKKIGARPFPGLVGSLAGGPSGLYAESDGALWRSQTGATWRKVGTANSWSPISAVTATGVIAADSDNRTLEILTSGPRGPVRQVDRAKVDGVPDVSAQILDVAGDGRGNTVQVGLAAGHAAVWRNTDVVTPTDHDLADHPIHAVAHGRAGWIAAADTGVWTSKAGERWSRAFPDIRNVRHVAANDNGMLAAGDGVAWYSTNRTAWQRIRVPWQKPAHVAAGPLGLVVVEGRRKAWFSPDGRTWHRQRLPPQTKVLDLAVGDDRIMAVGTMRGGRTTVMQGDGDDPAWKVTMSTAKHVLETVDWHREAGWAATGYSIGRSDDLPANARLYAIYISGDGAHWDLHDSAYTYEYGGDEVEDGYHTTATWLSSKSMYILGSLDDSTPTEWFVDLPSGE